MFELLNNLWILLTVFFTDTVISYPLFMAFLLFPVIFYVIYLLISLLDFSNWRG